MKSLLQSSFILFIILSCANEKEEPKSMFSLLSGLLHTTNPQSKPCDLVDLVFEESKFDLYLSSQYRSRDVPIEVKNIIKGFLVSIRILYSTKDTFKLGVKDLLTSYRYETTYPNEPCSPQEDSSYSPPTIINLDNNIVGLLFDRLEQEEEKKNILEFYSLIPNKFLSSHVVPFSGYQPIPLGYNQVMFRYFQNRKEYKTKISYDKDNKCLVLEQGLLPRFQFSPRDISFWDASGHDSIRLHNEAIQTHFRKIKYRNFLSPEFFLEIRNLKEHISRSINLTSVIRNVVKQSSWIDGCRVIIDDERLLLMIIDYKNYEEDKRDYILHLLIINYITNKYEGKFLKIPQNELDEIISIHKGNIDNTLICLTKSNEFKYYNLVTGKHIDLCKNENNFISFLA